MIALALWLAAVGGAASIGMSLGTTVLARAAWSRLERLDPRARARVWLGAAVLPPLIAAALCAAILVPHPWFGLPDHCRHHDGHMHLCLRHGAPWPGAAVLIFACLWLGRVALSLGREIGRLVSAARALHHLRETWLEGPDDLALLPLPSPAAFTAGFFRPRVYASEAVGRDERWRAVLAHERDHVRHRDPLARLVARMALVFHAPGVRRWLEPRLIEAQELAADEAAARHLGDRVGVAEQLVAWTRAARFHPAAASAFGQGDLERRVGALLERPRYAEGPSSRRVVVAAGALTFALLASFAPIHHAVETVLGLLGS